MNILMSFVYGLCLSSFSLSLMACSAGGMAPLENENNAARCSAGSPLGKSEAGLDVIALCIDKKDGDTVDSTLGFAVEIAASADQQARGLMFRTELADDKGMIFPYQSPRILSFWMKNTVISLDIIFINEDGSIANIAKNTEPYSTKPVSSINPTVAVLELRAGLTSELGIKAGDIIRWK